jgi:hypothetical protein
MHNHPTLSGQFHRMTSFDWDGVRWVQGAFYPPNLSMQPSKLQFNEGAYHSPFPAYDRVRAPLSATYLFLLLAYLVRRSGCQYRRCLVPSWLCCSTSPRRWLEGASTSSW